MLTQEHLPLQTLADLLESLGGIPPARVRIRPAPGTATVDDVVLAERCEDRLCELVDGVLVEKSMGFRESLVAIVIGSLLRAFVTRRKLGVVFGEAGMLRLAEDKVRIPDVGFVSWARLPGGKVPADPVPALAPDLAVEVLSPGNTAAEMDRKVREYLEAGVRLVWLVDLHTRTVTVHSPAAPPRLRRAEDSLDGEDVLPGFSARVMELFAELDAQGE